MPHVLFSLIQFSVVCYTWSIFPKNDVWRPHSSYLLNLLVLLLTYFNVSFHLPLVFSLLCFMPHDCKPLALMDVLWNPSCSCFLLKSWKLFSTFASLCYHIDSLQHRLFIFLTNFVQLISMYDILCLTMCSLCLPYIVQISNFGHCISIFCGPQGSMLVDAGIQLPKLQRNTSTPARKALPALLHITIHLMTCKN